MKEIILRIRISSKRQQVGFTVEKNEPESLEDTLEIIGALDLIRQAYLNKLGVGKHGQQNI